MSVTTYALDLNVPGNALALWLALNQPSLFMWVYRRVRRARKRRRLACKYGLGQLAQDDFDIDTSDLDDLDDTLDSDLDVSADSDASDAITDLSSSADSTSSADATLGLVPVTVPSAEDLDTLDPSLLTLDNSSGAATLTAAGDSVASDGESIDGCANGAGDTTQSALGQVGTALSSPVALTALAGAAAGYFLANGDTTSAEATGVQIANAAVGNSPAPIATQSNGDGTSTASLVTSNADGSTTYTPLSSEDLSLLAPSSFTVFLSEYGVYIAGIGAAALLLILAAHHRKGHR